MASMACYQFTVVDEAGNVRPSASVRVDIEGGGLATLYSDRSAATPIGNPFTADAQGFAQFFLSGGAYKITATYGGASRVWRYVPISRAAEMLPATDGYIPFANDNGLTTDSNFTWDNTNKQLLLGRGTASLPAFGFVGDADTGAYSPSANTYAITTAGTRRINVSSGGSVSIGAIIGTGSPLEVAGNVYARLDQNSQTTFSVVNGDTGVSAVARMRLTSGTGSDFIFDASHANGGTFAAELVGDMFIGTNAVKSTNLTTQGLVRLKVGSSGNVGIGTTAPSTKLAVSGGVLISGDPAYANQSPGAGSGLSTQLDVWTASGNVTRIGLAQAGVNNASIAIPAGVGGMALEVGAVERMRIDASGNVGIGLTPVNKLDVTGSIGFGAPVTKTADFSLAATENDIICNKAGTLTITLPAASSWTGRRVTVRTITANTVVSASSNVVPAAGGAAGTAILAATAGKSCLLISDGTNWQIQLPN